MGSKVELWLETPLPLTCSSVVLKAFSWNSPVACLSVGPACSEDRAFGAFTLSLGLLSIGYIEAMTFRVTVCS